MRKLTTSNTYNHTIIILPSNSYYTKDLTFHTYYDLQTIDDLYLLSIKSCGHHHSKDNFKITIWLDSNNPLLNDEAFSKHFEFYKNVGIQSLPPQELISNPINQYILYKHGGCYFSPKFVFVRPMDSLFWTYGRFVGVFQNGPSEDIRDDMIISLKPECRFFKQYMDQESNNNIVIFPSSWIDPISVQNPFTTMNNYEELYKSSPFNASMKSYCVAYKNEESTLNTTPVNIDDHSFIYTQLDIVNKN